MPAPMPGYQLELPRGFAVGWVVEAVFLTEEELRWHGPGLIVETECHENADGEMVEWVRVLFESDGWDDWFSDPAGDPELAFHVPDLHCRRKQYSCCGEGPRVSDERLRAARAVLEG